MGLSSLDTEGAFVGPLVFGCVNVAGFAIRTSPKSQISDGQVFDDPVSSVDVEILDDLSEFLVGIVEGFGAQGIFAAVESAIEHGEGGYGARPGRCNHEIERCFRELAIWRLLAIRFAP